MWSCSPKNPKPKNIECKPHFDISTITKMSFEKTSLNRLRHKIWGPHLTISPFELCGRWRQQIGGPNRLPLKLLLRKTLQRSRHCGPAEQLCGGQQPPSAAAPRCTSLPSLLSSSLWTSFLPACLGYSNHATTPGLIWHKATKTSPSQGRVELVLKQVVGTCPAPPKEAAIARRLFPTHSSSPGRHRLPDIPFDTQIL